MGCCKSFAKFLLLTFNIFVWLAGGGLLGLGIYLRVEDKAEAAVAIANVELYFSACYLMIICGAIMFAVGFVGCCGAMMEHKCMLGTYFAVLAALLIVEIVVGIYAAVAHDQLNDEIKDAFNKTLTGGNDTSNVQAQSAITMEKTFKCCGMLNGCKDWEKAQAWGCRCTEGDANCTLASSLGCTVGETGGDDYIWANDCYDSVVEFFEDHVWTVFGVCIGIAAVLIIGMALAITICRTSKRSDYEAFYA